MSAPARITVELTLGPVNGTVAVQVPRGTPAGGVWGHLDRALAPGGPPDGVRYVLNGLRTIPGAPLRDGDHLLVAAPTD
ncbi:MAG: hypothetical protein RIB67_10655 [Miltoncostaeaceae bacterium]